MKLHTKTIHELDAALAGNIISVCLSGVSTTSTVVLVDGTYSEVKWNTLHDQYVGVPYRKLSIEEQQEHLTQFKILLEHS